MPFGPSVVLTMSATATAPTKEDCTRSHTGRRHLHLFGCWHACMCGWATRAQLCAHQEMVGSPLAWACVAGGTARCNLHELAARLAAVSRTLLCSKAYHASRLTLLLCCALPENAVEHMLRHLQQPSLRGVRHRRFVAAVRTARLRSVPACPWLTTLSRGVQQHGATPGLLRCSSSSPVGLPMFENSPNKPLARRQGRDHAELDADTASNVSVGSGCACASAVPVLFRPGGRQPSALWWQG